MDLFEKLREQYSTFIYSGYTVDEDADNIIVQYEFEIQGLEQFTPVWRFPKNGRTKAELAEDIIFKKLAFSLGMVELISYWKIACPKHVKVCTGKLDDKQKAWWKKLYYHGLGEFFYTNGIQTDIESFMDISSEGVEDTGMYCPVADNNRVLVPIGGGKDSAVSLELLKSVGMDIDAYIINPRGATVNTVKAAGLADGKTLVAKRTLDKRMLELNAKGFLNGHTPFSAIVAFSATIMAYLNGIHYIALSNEASANESTVKNSDVNHQYSKSVEFERDFHEYESEYIGSGTYYFSLLRPLSEFQIAKYFAAHCTQYHDIFRSCNAGSKEDKWCGHCPKCLFVFLILSPFIEHERMVEIFGTDMVNDESMIPVMDQLTGEVDVKPFECVGSRDEVNTACCMVIDKYIKENKNIPALYRHYIDNGQYAQYKDIPDRFSASYDNDNLLLEKFAELVKENCCK